MHSSTRVLLEQRLAVFAATEMSDDVRRSLRAVLQQLVVLHDPSRARSPLIGNSPDSLKLVPKPGTSVAETCATAHVDRAPDEAVSILAFKQERAILQEIARRVHMGQRLPKELVFELSSLQTAIAVHAAAMSVRIGCAPDGGPPS